MSRSPLYDELKGRINLADLINETHNLQANGAEYVACCPFHDERTPSFTVYEDRAKGWRYHCHGCSANGDAIDWMEKQRGMSHADAIAELSQRAGLVALPAGQQSQRIGNASEVWQRSQPGNGHVQAYLASRGLHMDEPPAPLRQLDSLPYSHDRQIIGSYPVMLSPVVLSLPTPGEHLQPVAVHRTYLQADGAGKADVPVARKLLGKAAGGFVPLADPRGGDTLALAEGIEDALAVMLATGIPCWAVVSAGNMPKVVANVPDCVTKLRIFADDDKAGANAARETADAWRQARGRTSDVVTILPPGGCKDANASYVQDQGAGLRAALVEAIAEAEKETSSPKALNVSGWLLVENHLPKPDPILAGLWDEKTKLLIAGPSKARKSFFALELALRLSGGAENLLGFDIPAPRRVFLVNAEVNAAHYQARLNSVHQGVYGTKSPPDTLGERLWALNCRGSNHYSALRSGEIKQRTLELSCEVVVIDPVYKFLKEGREDSTEFKEFLALLDDLTESTGAAIAYIHHYAKGQSGDRQAIDRAAGSGYLARDFDAAIFLTPHARDDLLVLESVARNYPPRDNISVSFDSHCHVFRSSNICPQERTSRSGKPPIDPKEALALFPIGQEIKKSEAIAKVKPLGSQRGAKSTIDELITDGFLEGLERTKQTEPLLLRRVK